MEGEANYGDIELQSKEISGKIWTEVKDLTEELKGNTVLIRGHAQLIYPVGKRFTFLVVREGGFTVQCVVNVPEMVKFAAKLSRESIVDIQGVVSVPSRSIIAADQQVEIQVKKLYCVNRAIQ